jgi:isopenicillin N synthase-like dioxygenase
MSTPFSSLPVISLSGLSNPDPEQDELIKLSSRLDETFCTTGFAYLKDFPLTYKHKDIFNLCDDFFGPGGLSEEEKMKLAKKTFAKGNKNTYRGYVSTPISRVQLTKPQDTSHHRLARTT